jgi:hypothetical protein
MACALVAPAGAGAKLGPDCAPRTGKEVSVILVDTSGVPLPGREAEALAVVKEIMVYYEGHWPLAVPRRVLVDITGEVGRIHLVAVKASLAAHEQQMGEQEADAGLTARFQRLAALTVPGTGQQILQRLA